MKVLLAFAPYDLCWFYPEYQTKKSKIGGGMLIPGATHPLGLLYLSSALKKEGFQVKIFDGVKHTLDEFFKTIDVFRPDLIGFSSTAPLWKRTLDLAKRVKTKYNLPIVVGGANINTAGVDIISHEPNIDFAIQGDAELVLPSLCRELEAGKREFKTRGVAWKKNKKLVKNFPMPFYSEDLDIIPFPDREAIHLNDYCPSIGFYRKRPTSTMITSRGCVHNCFFCHDSESVYRARSISNVIEEFKEMQRMGIKDVILYDQDFGTEKERAIRLCREIVKHRIKIFLSCNLSIESFDKELVHEMKKAGFWKIFYGIESASLKNYRLIDKQLGIKKIKKVVTMTDKLGIQVFGSFIFGFPGDTKRDLLEVIGLAKSLPLSYAKFVSLSPWPGKEIFSNLKKYGKIVSHNPADMAMNNVNFVPHNMTKSELEKILRLAYKKFYIRPGYMLKRLLQIETIEDVKQNLRGFLTFFKA